MRNTRELIQVAVISAASLVSVAIGVAVIFLAFEVLSPSELWSRYGAFRAGLYATLACGAIPAMVLGAPAYWLLWRIGRARWTTVVPLGALLGALVALVEPYLVSWGISCGIVVAGLTHLSAKRWLSPSIRPGRRRDAA